MTTIELSELTIKAAENLALHLQRVDKRIVLAESCTAGLVSATLARISGISEWMCGSAVTYRDSVKENWLGIDRKLIEKHSAVSGEVTSRMAETVLLHTPEAHVSLAITGHLEETAVSRGPFAISCVGYRHNGAVICEKPVEIQLSERSRVDRQWQAAKFALETANNLMLGLKSEASRNNDLTVDQR